MPGVSRGDPSGHQGGGLRDEGDRLIEGAGAGSGVVVPGLPQGDAAGHHPGVAEGDQGLAGKNRNSLVCTIHHFTHSILRIVQQFDCSNNSTIRIVQQFMANILFATFFILQPAKEESP